MKRLKQHPDSWAILILIVIWLLFFWRVWTPFETDRLSFTEGDFSGQFVAWTGYAVERLDAGEIPFWNPYHYAGAPFQASSQTALTYPPHMLTLAILTMQAEATPQDVYTAIQWEVMLHVLLASLFVYLFVRRLLMEGVLPNLESHQRAALGGVVAGIAYAYGGYLGAYPILQVPLLEAGIWLPLVLLGILEATRPPNEKMGWMCLVLSGVMFAICLLAGHPQTALFTFYMAVAFLAYRVYARRWNWQVWVMGVLVVGAIGGILSAVQLLPTAEFTRYTVRTGFSFDDKGGGYGYEELINIFFPVRGKIWVPLYSGIPVLVLAGVAIWRRVGSFFAGTALFALLLSFGAKSPVYGILYPLIPGLSLFRGQERATFLIAFSLAVLAGLGVGQLMVWGNWREKPNTDKLRRVLLGLLAVSLVYTAVMYFLAQTEYRTDAIVDYMSSGVLTSFVLATMVLGLNWYMSKTGIIWQSAVLIALVVFDLFSVTAMLDMNYQSIPTRQRMLQPPYVTQMVSALETGERIDGEWALPHGYSTAFHLPDIQGSDPLQLDAMKFYLQDLPLERRWELLNVRIGAINTDAVTMLPVEQIGEGVSEKGAFVLWQVNEPRGFARPIYEATILNSMEEARGLTYEPAYPLRNGIILEQATGELRPDENPDALDSVTLTRFDPEHIAITISVPRPAVLSLAMPYFPGWSARVDGQSADILRAYGGLSAVYLPEGEHQVTLDYHSRWFDMGAVLSGMGWLLVGMLVIGSFWRARS